MKKEEDKNVDINEAEILEAWSASEYEREPKPIKKKKKVVRRKKKICKNVVDINHFRAENVKQYNNRLKASAISHELADFMGLSYNRSDGFVTMTKREILRFMTDYVKRHNLSDPRNRRRINPDAKLQSLLKIPVGEQLNFFNLQKYLRPHLF